MDAHNRAAAVFVAVAEAAEKYGVFFPCVLGIEHLLLADVEGARIVRIETNGNEELQLVIDRRVIPYDEAKRMAALAEPVAMAKGVRGA